MRARCVRRRALLGWAMAVLLLGTGAMAQRRVEEGLEELPRPDVSGMEPAVRRQLEDERQGVAALLRSPDATRDRLGQAYGRLGQLYYGYALRLPAAVCYRNAIRLVPDEARWHYYLGVIHQDDGRVEEALAELALANELEPYVPALVRMGDLELGRNRLAPARAHYERALEAHASSAAARVGLGRVETARGEPAAAIGHFEKALELQPQADRIHYLLGQAYRRLGDMDRARAQLERAGSTRVGFYDPLMIELQRQSVGAGAALDRGAEARMQGLYDVALREYRAAVEANPTSGVARRSLGSILAITGAEDEAIAEFRAALELEPDRPDAEFALGHLLAGQGRTAEARPHLERAAELDRRMAEARYSLGALLAANGEFEAAAVRYREILEIDPEAAEARLELGKVLVQSGRETDGVAQFDRVIAAGVEAGLEARARYYRAIAELRGGDEAGGLASLRRAVELDPSLAEAGQALAGVLIRRGRHGEAVAVLDRLLERQPANANARLARMTAQVFSGDIAGALRGLEEALTVLPESPEIRFNLARLLACGPDPGARDGARALRLAEELQREAPNLQHAETLAMALAEAGRFDDAVGLQSRLVDQARQIGNPALTAQLEGNLDRYRRRESCALGAGGRR